ncbi:hypothetical protein Y1Q_0008970 [Alligator mississippiensis]|uniref:Uncharacterized protein n=1 Tax=Alligator mississippiensis TaxID=8496 RepID=A0A151NLC1_ALLMI|nr:hypothetical protein Y1Q_0008970 [Alligator mississippiensis]
MWLYHRSRVSLHRVQGTSLTLLHLILAYNRKTTSMIMVFPLAGPQSGSLHLQYWTYQLINSLRQIQFFTKPCQMLTITYEVTISVNRHSTNQANLF